MFVRAGVEMRDFTIADAQNYMELYNHPAIQPFIPHDMVPQTMDQSVRQINSLFLRGRPYPYWAIVQSETNLLIGTCGFIGQDTYHRRVEIAYDLHPNFQKQGIMQDAVAVCIKYAFKKMNAERIEAVMLPENVASANVLLRLGFSDEGILRQYKFFRHKMRDVRSFSFVREDFNKLFK